MLALAPVFFAADFGLVRVLAGADDPGARVAAGAPPDTTVEAVPTVVEAPTGRATPPTIRRETPTTASASTGQPAPPADPGTVEIDSGRSEGMFRLTVPVLVPSFRGSTVSGQFSYLGAPAVP